MPLPEVGSHAESPADAALRPAPTAARPALRAKRDAEKQRWGEAGARGAEPSRGRGGKWLEAPTVRAS